MAKKKFEKRYNKKILKILFYNYYNFKMFLIVHLMKENKLSPYRV